MIRLSKYTETTLVLFLRYLQDNFAIGLLIDRNNIPTTKGIKVIKAIENTVNIQILK